MPAEYIGGSVTLKMDLESGKKTVMEKLTSNMYHLLFGVGFISWLIILSLLLNQLHIGLQTLQDENNTLKKEIKDLKDGFKLCDHKIGTIGEHLVDAFVPKHDQNDNLTVFRKDFLKKIKTDVYKEIGNHGNFYSFDFPMNYTHGTESCKLIDGHILEFDETDPNIHDFFIALVEEFQETDRAFDFWIGLTDLKTEGSFKWSHSEKYYSKMPIAMSLWSRGEPNHLESEHCVEVHDYRKMKSGYVDVGNNFVFYDHGRKASDIEKFELKDIDCDHIKYVICKKND